MISRHEAAAKAYDAMADLYAADVETNVWNALYERPAMQGMLGDVSRERVLDAGCGPGLLSEWLLGRGAEVVAIDASAEMVRISRDRLSTIAQIYHANLADPLPFLDAASFDAVAASLVLHYLEDWRTTLREFHRILRPTGRFVFSTHHPFMDVTLFDRPNYFTTELLNDRWEKAGHSLQIQFYRRPLTKIAEALFDAGFVIDGLLEPQPLPQVANLQPKAYETLSKRPWFLLVRARRRSREHTAARP